MKRTLVVLGLVGAGLVAAARTSAAQTAVRLGGPTDTMFGAVPGAPVRIPVNATNPYFYAYGGYCGSYYCPVTYARLTFGFDPAKVQSVSATPSEYGSVVATPGTGTVTVTASDLYADSPDQTLFNLQVTLLPGAGDGAYVWVRVDSLAAYSFVIAGGNTLVRSSVGQVCHATELWGDVDGNGRVDSRDALITLSAAVGLPVTGFPGLATRGDVDGDGLVNSRDALMMLSYAVDVPTDGVSRVGGGPPDACPAPSAPGETVVFQRSGTAAGLYRLDAASTTPAQITANAQDWFPRVDPSGQYVVFKCDSLPVAQLCRSDLTGAGRRYLDSTLLAQSTMPDWSPDGTKIAFLQSGFLSLMDSSGANRGFAFLGVTPDVTYGANGVGWSRDGTRLAYGKPSNGVHTVTLDTTHVIADLDLSISDGDQMRWSADGANVLFSRSNWTIWSVPGTGGTAQRIVAFQGGSRAFDVGPQGILFTATGPGGGNAVWLLQGGATGPIVRLTSPPAGSDDVNPSFRRNP